MIYSNSDAVFGFCDLNVYKVSLFFEGIEGAHYG